MVNRSENTLGQLTVQDGASNTLMFGETLGGTGIGLRRYSLSWAGVGALPTYLGLGRGDKAPDEGGGEWYRFSSNHRAVVYFCFGDGSVRGVRFGTTATKLFTYTDRDADWFLLHQLAGRRDGYVRDRSGVSD
jgi:hypothetical protein